MADEEAAFLGLHTAIEGGTAGGNAQEQADASSSDEYDPSEAVQTDYFPQISQNSSIQSPFNEPLLHPQNATSIHPPNSASLSAPLPPGPNAFERQSLSRSMSRASSQSTDAELVITTHHEPGTETLQSNQVRSSQEGGGDSSLEMKQAVSPSQTSDPSLNISKTLVSSENVSVKIKDQSSPGPVQNGVIDTVSNPAPVVSDIGRSSDSKRTIKSTDALPDPQALEAATPNKQQTNNTNPIIPRSRLPHDKIGILEDRIKEDPRGDLNAWLTLIAEHRMRAKIEDARSVYERFLTLFPSSGEQWVAYAQMENEAQTRGAMDQILSRALPQNDYLPLWSLYLDHIRRRNNLETDTSGAARNVIRQAYDVALQRVGLDKDSGKLWQDYINFIKSGPGAIGGKDWRDQQKMDDLRKQYQRAICIPTQSTSLLWKEYDGFEMGLNKMTGRKFLQDQSPSYMSARGSYAELQNITRKLRQTTMPVLPPAPGFDGDVEHMEQLGIWKRWIQWEKDDPLVLKQELIDTYRARVIFVYKHALMAMRFCPELWCDASDFCFSNDLEAEGNDFLTQGIAANPESVLLAFKRADRIEHATANEEGNESAIRRGTAVREPYDKVLDALYELISVSKDREAQAIARIEAEFTTSSNAMNGTAGEDENEAVDAEAENDKEKQKIAQIQSVKNMHAAQINLLSKTLSHVWIALIRAMRRIQGKGKPNDPIAGARGTFADARKRGRILSDVYIACALIEFHCYEVETGKKIFERGLKLFPEDEAFALEYIKHLVANNDHTNARVVFETAVTKLAQKPETVWKAKPLYAFFHEFESRYGELTQIVKLEKRMSDLFPEDPALTLFAQRFQEQGFDPTAIRPIISPATQARPKTIPSTEPIIRSQSPLDRSLNVTTNSPKRPLPFDESDTEGRPSKIARGVREVSPLKGAAGRRLDQQKKNRPNDIPQSIPIPPPPPPLPRDVMFLLSIIPKAETYHATKFDPAAIVRLLRETTIPHPQSLAPLTPHAPPPVIIRPPPQPQPNAPFQHMPPQMPPQPPPTHMPPMPNGQYHGQFNGGYLPFPSATVPSPLALSNPDFSQGGISSKNQAGYMAASFEAGNQQIMNGNSVWGHPGYQHGFATGRFP